MRFCSSCGTVMNMDRAKQSFVCPKCGAEEPLDSSIVYSKGGSDTDKVVVVGKKEMNIRTTPQAKIICPKCDNNTAYWWLVQTRGIDESSTQFYRCTKCGYTWREYS